MTSRPPAPAPDPLFADDEGNLVDPSADGDWTGWVAAGATRAWLKDDPLMDWLNRFGDAKGFARDDADPGWDARTDFTTFIWEMGSRFEAEVMRLIGLRLPVTVIARERGDARDPEKARETREAMRRGDPVIAQAVLRNPQTRTHGVADLLVRSDRLNDLVPGTLRDEEAAVNAPALGDQPWHYRVIDIKFKGLSVDHQGRARSEHLVAEMAQVWIYNEALARIQGYAAPSGYLLGRHAGGHGDRRNCFDRLAGVDRDATMDQAGQVPLRGRVEGALAWVRWLVAEGATWEVLPVPTVPELYPDMDNDADSPWHGARTRIGRELGELTMLYATKPKHRRAAHAAGVFRWDDPRVTAELLGTYEKARGTFERILDANRRVPAVVLPERIGGASGSAGEAEAEAEGGADIDAAWRTPAPVELYVDFETITGVYDDFTRMPLAGGRSLIFQVGAGWWEGDRWAFRQWTAGRLTDADEADVIDGFLACIYELLAVRGATLDDLRLVHWASHEPDTYERTVDSACARHPDHAWPNLPWFDALERIIHRGPVAIAGQLNFGLKSVAKAMHAAGLIETTWAEGPGDGMGAMVGAIRCDTEAARTGGSMRDDQLMQDIGKYNEVDCRAMAEVVRWLRANR